METFHSEESGPTAEATEESGSTPAVLAHVDGGAGSQSNGEDGTGSSVHVPPGATADEAAAIVAAIGAHLADLERATEAADDRSARVTRWTLSGRLSRLVRRPVRVPRTGPDDAWTASGRVDRF